MIELSIDRKIQEARATTLILCGVAIGLALCLSFILLSSATQSAAATLTQYGSTVR
jgi:hypothetical protein